MNYTERIARSIESRREFLKVLGAAGVLAGLPRFASGQVPNSPEESPFVFTRVQYDKGDWNTDMLTEGLENGSEINLVKKLYAETGYAILQREHAMRADNDAIFDHPFLYMTGHGECDLTGVGRDNVRRILERGGFLLGDNCAGGKGSGFDRAFKTQIKLMFPEGEIKQLPMNHPVFSSYWRIDKVLGGDKRLDPYLEGMDVNGRTAVVYTRNDLGCAWEGHPCKPGGDSQREHAFMMGINLVYYALSGM